MNSTFNSTMGPAAAAPQNVEDDGDIDFGHYIDVLAANKWLIAAITLIVFLLGTAYALMERPVYESTVVVQVEDLNGAGKGAVGDAAGFFDIKTPTSAEMELMRSRMVVAPAVDAT